MITEILLSSWNPSKKVQIQAVFDGSPILVRTLDEFNVTDEAVEDGATLEENSEKKVRFAQERVPGLWTFADDTGIFINALNGAPGVHSARWAGPVSTDEIMQFTLKKLEGVADRSAVFRTIVTVLSPDGELHRFSGEVPGLLLTAPRREPHPKMPYSPIFVPEGETLTWSEMDTEYENSISHRGKAFRKARAFLESL